MNKERIMVVAGVRTPFCKMGTDLSSLSAADLGRTAVSALLTKLDMDPQIIEEVILGCVAQPADAMNLARVVALRSGIPKHIPAVTVHRNCASGCEAITDAFNRIRAERGDVYLVGGVESMSAAPLLFSKDAASKFTVLARAKSNLQKLAALVAFRPSDFAPVAGLRLGLNDPVSGLNMGQTAEILAREFGVSRGEQDAFALESHLRASAAKEKMKEEIIPAYDLKRGKAIIEDNGIRPGQTLEALAKLRPVFEKGTGTVTAGNSSQITDGAVALLIASESAVRKLGVEPLGVISDYAYVGCDPSRMGIGPVYAIQRLLKHSKHTLEEADIIEINEAFAAQVLAVTRLLKQEGIGEIDPAKLNVNGGAIALGHPVGATGARIVLTALKELERRNAKQAIASLCVGGGQGAALWLERP
ncbi:MAG: thiolase family protein [Chthoniobacterales bacterium]